MAQSFAAFQTAAAEDEWTRAVHFLRRKVSGLFVRSLARIGIAFAGGQEYLVSRSKA
jgi:hypothetical protein